MFAKAFEHGGNIHAAQRSKDKEFLDFSANINPLGLMPAIKTALSENIASIVHYPDAEAYELTTAIKNFYHIREENLVLGNGAAELLYIFSQIVRKKIAYIPVPTFSEYERAARSAEMSIQYFFTTAENNFAVDYQKMQAEFPENSILFLGQPNNPTGNLLVEPEKVLELIEFAGSKNSFVLIDESFIDFLSPKFSFKKYIDRYDNLVIINSLTKMFSLPGLRLGFGLFPEELQKKMNAAKDVWNVNTLAQIAGSIALNSYDYIAQTKIMVEELRQNFLRALEKFSQIKVYSGSVNFFLLDISETKYTSGEIRAKFFEYNILVRDCSNYIGLNKNYIRIAVRTAKENQKFLSVLQAIL